ncbi:MULTISPECIES: hypothetical protein [unclassified Micromonospora]|uniref:hypothetical protein n=1 Tax=unclassified Micromonospora TaxID=2617518 RepID=UPI001B35C674|nr:hypothetical protein [Micromonospora sp. C72]MBQ1053820.1 hypothetical protein [Micromonospora sp. C32]
MKAHRTDVVSFAFGLVFLGLSIWWLLARILGLSVPPVGWFLAGGLVLIGLLGLIGALRSGQTAEPPAPPEATVSAPYRDDSPAGGGDTTSDVADEWATEATTDVSEPATREMPAVDETREERRTPGDPA